LLSLSGTVRGSVGGFDPPGFTTGLATVEVADIAAGGSRLGFWSADGFSGVVGIAEDVELTPGLYRIRATASADGSAQISGGARFDIAGTFDASASCPADLTGDGIADLADIQFFIESFVTQQPAGDFNADGVYDLADIQGFIAAFNAGCPSNPRRLEPLNQAASNPCTRSPPPRPRRTRRSAATPARP
jgi:hypothetical protein